MHINGVLKCIVWTNKVRTFIILVTQEWEELQKIHDINIPDL